jgi:uncharacterized protein (DUF1499 family)
VALTRNRARTKPDHADPRLRSRTYGRSVEEVWDAALAVAEGTRRWRIVRRDAVGGDIGVEARSPLWGFVDDVVVRLSPESPERTRVELESASRRGRADLGANARRIAHFLQRLDARLRTER